MAPKFRVWGRRAALLLLAGGGTPLVARALNAQIQAASGQLVYAVYEGQEAAAATFGGLRGSLAADRNGAYAIVAKDLSGQITVQEQVGGTLGRSVFLRGFTALLGPSGGQGEAGTSVVDTVRTALAPGSSGIFALVDAGWMETLRTLLEPTRPVVLGVTVVGSTAQRVSSEGQGIRASPPVHSTVTGYTPGTDYEPGVGIEPGTGYAPGAGIQADTADMPNDADR
ncbi:MAG: hypothetical protein ACREOC_01910 [Gemmatimonadales bacterium]